MFKICTDQNKEYYGLLCRMDSYYVEADEFGENYNYGKYLTHVATRLFTRYRYKSDLSGIFTYKNDDGESKDYRLIPEGIDQTFSGLPNNGKTTTFVESVKVSFGNESEIFLKDKTKFPDPITCGYIKSK